MSVPQPAVRKQCHRSYFDLPEKLYHGHAHVFGYVSASVNMHTHSPPSLQTASSFTLTCAYHYSTVCLCSDLTSSLVINV